MIEEKEYKISKLIDKLDKEGINVPQAFNEINKKHEMEQYKQKRLEKVTMEYSKLSSQMQEILAENAVLRQIAKVPDNFGALVDDIKIEREGNMDQLEKKVELLEKDNEELEEERASLKHKLRQMSVFLSAKNQKRYKGLTTDQLAKVDQFALNLKEGNIELPMTDKTKELSKENEKLRAQIEALENQASFPVDELMLTLQNFLDERSVNQEEPQKGGVSKEDFETILENYTEKMEDMMRNAFADAQPVSNSIATRRSKLMIGTNSEANLRDRRYPGGKYNGAPKLIPGMFGDMSEANAGYSTKFKSKIHLNDIEEEQPMEMDIKTAKIYLAALQLQNLENLEYIRRKEEETQALSAEVQDMKAGMKRSLFLQDQLFINHHKKLVDFDDNTKDLKEKNRDLETTNLEINRKLELFEKSLAALRSNSENRIENRMNELTKRSAIAETNVIKLSRKYSALQEEHNNLLEKWRKSSSETSGREKDLIEKLEGLKAWKEEATEKLRIMLERSRNSVSIEVHRGVKAELELATEKYANLKLREAEIVNKLTQREALEREFSDQVEEVRRLEDELSSTEIEIEVLQLRLNAIDPIFKKYTTVFRKLANLLKEKNVSPLVTFEFFDKNRDGNLSRNEVIMGFNSMGINTTEDENEVLFMFLDLDGSGQIDYREFCRRLKRTGVAMRTKEEEIMNQLWGKITNSGLTLEQAFKVFDKNSDNLIDYNDMLTAFENLGITIEPTVVSHLFRIADVTGDGKISNAEFNYIFKKYNKVSYEVSEETYLDWKYDIMAKIDKVATDTKVSLEDVFKSLDTDLDNKIDLDEFDQLFEALNIRLEKREFEKLFYAIDTNKTGFIGFTEFLSYINRAKREAEKVQRAKLIRSKRKKDLSESTLAGIDNDPNSDPTTRLQLKISLLEAKERSSKRQLEKMALKINQLEDQIKREEFEVKSLEEANVRTKKEYYEEKKKRTLLESRYQAGISKEESGKLIQRNESLRINNSQLTGALNTLRNLYEAAVNEAKNLKLSSARNQDEINQLRAAVMDLQSESDEKTLIGKLYKTNLNMKWSEANTNQRYDLLLDEMRKLKIENSKLEARLKSRDDELYEMQSAFTEKLMIVETQLKEARISILPTLSISRVEDLSAQVKRLAESKIELEVQNKKLRETNYENSVRIESYIMKEKNLAELEQVLRTEHPDELSQRVVSMTNKLSEQKLKSLKAERELFLVKEREEYYARVYRTQVDHIKRLETEISQFNAKYNEREEFWRKRYNDQLKKINTLFSDKNMAYDENYNLIEKEKNPSFSRQNMEDIKVGMKQMAKTSKEVRQLNENKDGNLPTEEGGIEISYRNRGAVKEYIKDLQEKNKIMREELNMNRKKMRKMEHEAEAKIMDVNYEIKDIDHLAFQQLQDETKDMAKAAQATIVTLQGIIDEKNEEIEIKERTIDEMKAAKLEQVKKMRKVELKCERLERELVNNEANRMNMDHFSSVKILQKLGSMNHKEMENIILGYENKIKILTEEMEFERTNTTDLINKLKEQKLHNNRLQHSMAKQNNDDELAKLKDELRTLTLLNKKKHSELKKLKKYIEELKRDLLERDREIVLEKKTTAEKLTANTTQAGEAEVKLSALTKKFRTLNKKLKEANDVVNQQKLAEIKHREKMTELTDENSKLKAFNLKMRDENIKLKKARRKGLGSRQARKGATDSEYDESDATSRQEGGRRNSRIPRGSKGGRRKTEKLLDRDEREIQRLKNKIKDLERINSEMISKLKADFIDKEDGILIPTKSSAFTDLEEMLDAIKKFLRLNSSVKLYPLMKQCDTRNLGVIKMDDFVRELSSVGIKFGQYDQKNFIQWIPQDKLGNINYEEFYNLIKGHKNKSIGTRGDRENAAGSKKKSMMPRKERKLVPDKADRKETSVLQQERNINLLRKKLDEKVAEIKRLTSQLHGWREKASKLDQELKERQNKRRQMSIPPAASDIDHRAPTQATALKMIKDLEDQVSESKRLMNYEVEKRDSDIQQLNDSITNLINENKMLNSENDAMRLQLEKIFQQRLTPNQLNEEKEKQRELLLSSLMAKLEKSRTREAKLADKVQLLEKENIELKYIKEGIDTRIESLNRKNRELQNSLKPLN